MKFRTIKSNKIAWDRNSAGNVFTFPDDLRIVFSDGWECDSEGSFNPLTGESDRSDSPTIMEGSPVFQALVESGEVLVESL